jgi:hypothetical protein
MISLSTGLRKGMLDNIGFREAFANGVIYVYTGAQPINADAAVQGTLLGKVTLNGGAFAHGAPTNGLNFDAPTAGIVVKAALELWQLVGLAIGTAGWGRLCGNAADSFGQSLILPRFDFSIATSGGDLSLSTVQIAVGAPTTIDVFQFTLP